MRALSAVELLEVWDRGRNRTPVERALTMLDAACPEAPPGTLAGLDIGRRDAELLALRERIFGARMTGVATCRQCGERLELAFVTDDVRVESSGKGAADPVRLDGYDARFRLPDSGDLAAASTKTDLADQRHVVMARCIVSAHRDGEPVAVEDLPAHVIDAIEEAMQQAAPQADILLDVACPCCGHSLPCAFDIVSYFWNEIETWAWRTLRDVHELASAYGWHEREILSMSAGRRQCYLDMVRA
jgi:hypothetical protein